MAIKNYCDVCLKEIGNAEMKAEFVSLERDIFKGQEEPGVSKIDLCEQCKKDLKLDIARLIQTKKDAKK